MPYQPRENSSKFLAGFDNMNSALQVKSFEECRAEFMRRYPVGCKFTSMDAYLYAMGECKALANKLN